MMFFLRNSFLLLKQTFKEKEPRLISASIFLVVFSMAFMIFLSQRLSQGILEHSLSLLGSDQVIVSNTVIDQKISEKAKQFSLKTSLSHGVLTMIEKRDLFFLTEVRAVEEPYPLLGQLWVRDSVSSEVTKISSIPEPDTIWVEERLFSNLNLSIDERLKIGNQFFKITKILVSEPSKIIDSIGYAVYAPLILMNKKDIVSTGIFDEKNSHITYRLFIAGPKHPLMEFKKWLMSSGSLKPLQSYITPESMFPFISQILRKFDRYLSFVFLINLFLSGILIFVSVRDFSFKQLKTVGVLRAFGSSRLDILFSYSLMLFFLMLASAFLGISMAMICEYCQRRFVFFMTTDFSQIGPVFMQVARNGVLVIFGFCFLSASIFFMRIFCRRPLFFLNIQSGVSYFSQKFFSVLRCSKNKNLFSGGIVCSVFHKVICRATENIIQILALSIVFGFSLGIFQIKNDFMNDWKDKLNTKNPNYFITGIPRNDLAEFENFLRFSLRERQDYYPLTVARLMYVNNDPVSMDGEEKNNPRVWPRLLRITSAKFLKRDNSILTGQWFTESDQEKPVVSVEAGFAARLGIKLGDSLVFSIYDRLIRLKVTSLRLIAWDSFEPNFLIMVPVGLLDKDPKTYLTSIYVPSTEKYFFNQLLKKFPMVSVIDVEMIVSQVREFIEQACECFKMVWLVNLLMSLLLLWLLVMCSSRSRSEECLLLKKLGITPRALHVRLWCEWFLLSLMIVPIAFSIAQYLRIHFAQNLTGLL